MEMDIGCDRTTLFISQKSNQQQLCVRKHNSTTAQHHNNLPVQKREKKRVRANPSVNRYSKATLSVLNSIRMNLDDGTNSQGC